MNKFTVFTVILAVCVITVTINLVMQDMSAKSLQSSVISQTPVTTPTTTPGSSAPEVTTPVATTPEVPVSLPTVPKFEFSTGTTAPELTINSQLVSSAGFPGLLKEDAFSGKVFELFDITSTTVQTIGYFIITDNGNQIASITEVVLPDEIRALQLYMLLQNRSKTYIDLSLNETNAYGDRSFYINHAKKSEEAFLTVKIGKTIYAVAYVKSYHEYVKALITLLTP